MEAVEPRRRCRILRLFGDRRRSKRRPPRSAPEQEYFLIDREALSTSARTCACAAARSSAHAARRGRSWTTTTSAPSARASRAYHEGARRGAVEARRALPRRSTTRWLPPSTRWPPSITDANTANDQNQLAMETMKKVAEPPRPGVPAARKALRGRQRLRQAQQLVALRPIPARTCSTPARPPWQNAAVPAVPRRRSSRRVDEYQELLRMLGGLRRQRPPSRRAGGAAGHHLHLPRRRAGATSWTRIIDEHELHRDRAARAAHRRGRRCPPFRRTPPTATAPRPLAFTGNKFEFRMPGSSQSIAGPDDDHQRHHGR